MNPRSNNTRQKTWKGPSQEIENKTTDLAEGKRKPRDRMATQTYTLKGSRSPDALTSSWSSSLSKSGSRNMQSKTPKATVKTIINELPKSPSRNWGEELPEEVQQQLQENNDKQTHPEYANHFPSLGDTPLEKKGAYLSPPNKQGSDFIREILSPSNAIQKGTQVQGFGDKVQQYMDSFGEKDPNESKSQSPRSLKSVASTTAISATTKEEDQPTPQRESDDQKETQHEANPTPLFEEKTSDEKNEVNNKEISFEQVRSQEERKSLEIKEPESEHIDEPNPSNTEKKEDSEYLAFPVGSHSSEPVVTIEEKEETSTEKIPVSVTTYEETTPILEAKEIDKPTEDEIQGKEEPEGQEEQVSSHQKKRQEIEFCFQKALQYKKDNHFNFAILEFKKLLDLVEDTNVKQFGVSDEDILSYQIELASCLFSIGDFQECAQISRSILEKHPQSQRVLYYLGTSLMRQQFPEEGIAYLKQAKSAQKQEEEYSDLIEKEIKEYEDQRKPKQVKIEEPKLVNSDNQLMPSIEETKITEVEESKGAKMEASKLNTVSNTENLKEEKTPETPKENPSKHSGSIGLGTILGSAIGSGIFGFGIAKFVFGVSEKKGVMAGLAVSIVAAGVSLLFQK